MVLARYFCTQATYQIVGWHGVTPKMGQMTGLLAFLAVGKRLNSGEVSLQSLRISEFGRWIYGFLRPFQFFWRMSCDQLFAVGYDLTDRDFMMKSSTHDSKGLDGLRQAEIHE